MMTPTPEELLAEAVRLLERLTDVPSVPGFYWATNIKYGWREVVAVECHTTPKRSWIEIFRVGTEDKQRTDNFTDWSGPIADPREGET